MTTPFNPSQRENTYVIDSENEEEMVRLMLHDRLLTKSMGGLFPERSSLSTIHTILDIACGPGGWVLEVASAYPEIQVIGIDISQRMIDYACAQAWVQKLTNAQFRVMNALSPLGFPDNSFGLINARAIVGFMPTTAWPKLMQECLRILRPGGILRLTDGDGFGITNSPAFEKLTGKCMQALKLAGKSFSPDGRTIGISPMLGRFLRDAGYQHIQKMPHVIDYSAGTEAHESFCYNWMVALKLLQPFLINMGVSTQEEFIELYQQARIEMISEAFCAVAFFLSVWGEKAQSVL